MDDLLKSIKKVGITMDSRIFFDDETQTIRQQVRIGEKWINIKKAEHVPYKKEYFTRKLKGE